MTSPATDLVVPPVAADPSAQHLVKHADGWCVSADGEFPEEAYNVRTLCQLYVTLPFGYRVGRPDCPECLAALGR